MGETLDPSNQLSGGGVTMMVSDVLAQPVPQGFDGHEVRAVAGQRPHGDGQLLGEFEDGVGAVIRGAIPDDDEFAHRLTLTQAAQDGEGVLGVGAREVPDGDLSGVVEIEAIEADLGGQSGRVGADPEALPERCPAVSEIGLLVDVGFVDIHHQRWRGTEGALQERVQCRHERFACRRVGPIEQRLGLLPGEAQTLEGLAHGFAADTPPKHGFDPGDEALERPARRGGVGDQIGVGNKPLGWRLPFDRRGGRRGDTGANQVVERLLLDRVKKGETPPVCSNLNASGPDSL